MLDILINFGEILSPIFYKILYMSVIGSVVGIVVFALMKLFEDKLSAKLKCYLWIIPIIFLLLPINRIQINTKKDILITTAVDRFENAISSMSEMQFTEKLENTKVEKGEKSVTKGVQYTNKQIVFKLVPVIWINISAFGIIGLLLGSFKLNIKINMNKRCRNTKVKEILNNCRRRLKISRRIGIKFQDFNQSPCIYGIIHPRILIPNEFQYKNEETLENIFMHELSHYKRKDMITNYILLMVTAIHWFNPFVYYIFKKIRQDMELATDEIVLKQMNKEEKKRYGRTLISLLETYDNKKTSVEILCITDNNKNMERRIKKIKLEIKLKKYQKSIVILVITLVICALSPFILKINSIASNSRDTVKEEKETNLMDQYLIKKEQENKYLENQENTVNSSENIENHVNYDNEDNEHKSINAELEKEIMGEWKPYRAETATGEVDLKNIYGSGIGTYGGSLNLRADDTYTKFIGVYSEEQSADLVGNYEIVKTVNEEEIHYLIILQAKSGKIKVLTYLEDSGVIIEKIDSELSVYYTK